MTYRHGIYTTSFSAKPEDDTSAVAQHNANPLAHRALFASKLDKAGGAMTGALILAADPSSPLEAASKRYVDTALARIVAGLTNGNEVAY